MDIKLLFALFAGLLMSVPGTSPAQEQPGVRERADQLYSQYEYARAAPLYQKLTDKKRPKLLHMERLADCYMQIRDYEAAENWYARLVALPESRPDHLLLYGEALMYNGRYAAAREQFKQYGSLTGDGDLVNLRIAGCDSAVIWMAKPAPYLLRNEQEINTARAEFSVFPSGNRVYYASEEDNPAYHEIYGRTGHGFVRVFSASRGADNTLAAGSTAGIDINHSPYHTGPLAADADGKTLFVTRTYPGRRGGVTRDGGRSFRNNRLELYQYRQSGEAWEAEPFPYNNKEAYSVGHPALSPDGKILYFVSDMPGGAGGTDIWYCDRLAGGSWGQPVNAGPVINSRGNEMFPFIGADGTLYFSSDGFAGMGGLDVFRSHGSRTAWKEPVNMHYPVNSAADDFAFVPLDAQAAAGYISSNRKGGMGSDDIYSFSRTQPERHIVLRSTVSDKRTGKRLAQADVTLFDSGEADIAARKKTDEGGVCYFTLHQGNAYRVRAGKTGYHESTEQVTAAPGRQDTIDVALLLEPVSEKGATFALKNIYYNFDQHRIRPDAALVLDELVRTMRDNPGLKIRISSHTDSRGSDAYNMQLSQRRAQAAVDYIVGRGIARQRLTAQGYGESRPVNGCVNGVPCGAEAHQANRRTEITVMEY